MSCSASKGIFRKPDWDVAAGYYERAGKNFFENFSKKEPSNGV
jgi:hypothetical protein